MHDHHRRDAVRRVGGQPFGDGRRLDTPPPVPGNEVDDQPEALRHFTPQAGEMTGFERQHAIAGREGVDQRRFPCPGAGRGIDDDRTAGAEHRFDPLQQVVGELGEVRSAVVDGRLCDGAQHPVGDVGRSGDLQEMPSTVSGHYTKFHSMP